MMATTAPMQKPVSRMRMMPSCRPLTPLLQPPQSHRLLEALHAQSGWAGEGGAQWLGKGKVCKACHVPQVMQQRLRLQLRRQRRLRHKLKRRRS
jgi:hypothetical protein